jgi:hypothetical protein
LLFIFPSDARAALFKRTIGESGESLNDMYTKKTQ